MRRFLRGQSCRTGTLQGFAALAHFVARHLAINRREEEAANGRSLSLPSNPERAASCYARFQVRKGLALSTYLNRE